VRNQLADQPLQRALKVLLVGAVAQRAHVDLGAARLVVDLHVDLLDVDELRVQRVARAQGLFDLADALGGVETGVVPAGFQDHLVVLVTVPKLLPRGLW